MNVNQLCIAVEVNYLQKQKINKGKLELNSEMWIFFTFQQGLATS